MTSTLSEEARRHSPRQLVAASIGNLVEWYDWYAYSFLAIYFATQVFPTGTGLTALLNTFAIFAVGFFFRPIGGLLMGALADRIGRKPALTFTILAMGFGSLMIAVLPTHAMVGVLSPILLVVARCIQGLSVGGEFAASTTFLVESAPDGRRGLFSSFQYVSTTAGQLIASGLGAILANALSETQMGSWGWRIAFGFGALLSLVGFIIRAGAHETLADVDDMRTGKTKRPGIFDAILHYPKQSLLIVGITIAGTIAYYTWTTYLPTYANTYAGIPKATALTVGTISLVFFLVLQPIAGMVSDRVGRKPLLIIFAAAFVLLTVPGLSALNGGGFGRLLLVQCVGMIFLSLYTSIAAAVNAETIPSRVRASGIGSLLAQRRAVRRDRAIRRNLAEGPRPWRRLSLVRERVVPHLLGGLHFCGTGRGTQTPPGSLIPTPTGVIAVTRPADLPDYWLSRPAPLLDPTVAAEFDQLLAAAETSGPVQPIEYRSRHPLWQFLCHVADTGRYVLHGSGSGDVSQFEPRQANDSEEFGNRMGVYAAADGIWAMYYAVVDRALASGLVNACVRFGDPGAAPEEFHGPYYYFSVDADDHPAPWRTGYVYLLPADGFESQQQVDSDGRSVLIAQRFNPEPVRPTAQVVVHPEDFPYLEQVHRHVNSEINERHAADPDGFPWHTS